MALGAASVIFMKLYRYVGPESIAERVRSVRVGTTIASGQDVIAWMKATGQHTEKDGSLIVTYIVDEFGVLRIADRRSEHVVCAGGRQVRAAGEMTFKFDKQRVTVTSVSNQSTGYCPEPA